MALSGGLPVSASAAVKMSGHASVLANARTQAIAEIRL